MRFVDSGTVATLVAVEAIAISGVARRRFLPLTAVVTNATKTLFPARGVVLVPGMWRGRLRVARRASNLGSLTVERTTNSVGECTREKEEGGQETTEIKDDLLLIICIAVIAVDIWVFTVDC